MDANLDLCNETEKNKVVSHEAVNYCSNRTISLFQYLQLCSFINQELCSGELRDDINKFEKKYYKIKVQYQITIFICWKILGTEFVTTADRLKETGGKY